MALIALFSVFDKDWAVMRSASVALSRAVSSHVEALAKLRTTEVLGSPGVGPLLKSFRRGIPLESLALGAFAPALVFAFTSLGAGMVGRGA